MYGMIDVVLGHGTVLCGHGETSESVQAMELVVHGDCIERATILVGFLRGGVQQDETVVRDNGTPVIIVIHWMKTEIKSLSVNICLRGLTYPRSVQSRQQSSQLFGYRLEGTLALR